MIEGAGEGEGERHAASVTIKGRFHGEVTGGKVALQATAQVAGKITYERLSIENTS